MKNYSTRCKEIGRLEAQLRGAYKTISLRVDEDEQFIDIFADFPADRTGHAIADYFNYRCSIADHFTSFLTRSGWWAEWQNPEHIRLRRI